MMHRGQVVWISVAQARATLEKQGASFQETSPEILQIEVGIRHVGSVLAKTAIRKIRALRLEEIKRILAARKDLGPDGASLAPELYQTICRACSGKGKVKGEDCGPCKASGRVNLESLEDGDVRTPEGEARLGEVTREIFALMDGDAPLLAGVKNLEGAETTEDQIAELERFDLLQVFLGPAMEVQDPEYRFRPANEGASVAGEEGRAPVLDAVGA